MKITIPANEGTAEEIVEVQDLKALISKLKEIEKTIPPMDLLEIFKKIFVNLEFIGWMDKCEPQCKNDLMACFPFSSLDSDRDYIYRVAMDIKRVNNPRHDDQPGNYIFPDSDKIINTIRNIQLIQQVIQYSGDDQMRFKTREERNAGVKTLLSDSQRILYVAELLDYSQKAKFIITDSSVRKLCLYFDLKSGMAKESIGTFFDWAFLRVTGRSSSFMGNYSYDGKTSSRLSSALKIRSILVLSFSILEAQLRASLPLNSRDYFTAQRRENFKQIIIENFQNIGEYQANKYVKLLTDNLAKENVSNSSDQTGALLRRNGSLDRL